MANQPLRPPGETRALVAELRGDGLNRVEIARRLGCSKATVSFHARQLVAPTGLGSARYDWSEVRTAYESGLSIRECMDRFGFSRTAWCDAVRRGDVVQRSHREPIEDVLAAGRRRNRGHIKARLLRAGLKEPRCETCGLDAWQGAPLSLHLHHKNGDGLDNRLENLQLLCPNCHSQTDTWGGRNSGSRLSRARISE